MDMSTSTVAEGKIKVARNRGESLAPGLFVNARGEPSTSPEEYYADPPGALLPMAGHKGFALSLFCEVFAGALTGAGCSKSGVSRVANGFMAFLLDPAAFSFRPRSEVDDKLLDDGDDVGPFVVDGHAARPIEDEVQVRRVAEKGLVVTRADAAVWAQIARESDGRHAAK